ncbi:MAG: hypothetical protein ABF868_04920 [Sporolactobacillus sp.]
MPIPFLLVGIGAAVLGAGKSVKAGFDQKDANETNKQAQYLITTSTEQVNEFRKRSGDAITNLGKEKIKVLEQSIKPFVYAFEQLHNVEISNSVGLEELQKFSIDKQAFEQLKEMQTMASSIVSVVASGAAIGAITAFGAYGGAMAFGAASTGTAIASLSGVAATNATLAFLGGGALSVGGMGIAGGTMVLGGLVAGPALAVMGFVVGAKASANKDKAYSNLAQAKEYQEEMKTVKVVCKNIRRRAAMFERLIIKLNAIFEPLVYSLEQIIVSSGTDYSIYTLKQKNTVASAMSIAGAIKAVLDTPILTEDGKLTNRSKETADLFNKMLAVKNA